MYVFSIPLYWEKSENNGDALLWITFQWNVEECCTNPQRNVKLATDFIIGIKI